MGFTFLGAGKRLVQAAQALRGIWANAFGTTWYVDSVNGTDGQGYGLSPDKPLATIGYLITNSKLTAGDTVNCAAGGSETLTATLALATANVRLICDVDDPEYGYTLTGAGTLALLTVSAAGCKVRGFKFAHTGTTANAQHILTTNAADNLIVDNCLFDDSAISATWTGAGVEVVNACDNVVISNCIFKDTKFGVKFTMATGVVCARPKIKGCIFYVGQSAAFGIASALTGTGAVRGMIVKDCLFLEAIGSGAAATTAWDGTDGTNATQGPIKLEAAVDQFLITDCKAYTALGSTTFVNTNAINAGAAGSVVNSKTSTDASDLSTVIALHAKPTADAAANTNMRDVIGDKADAVLTAIAATKSILAYAKTCLQNIGFLADAAVYVVDTTSSAMAYIKGLLNLSGNVAVSSAAVMVDNDTLFTVSGGPVRIIALWSECVTPNDGTASTVAYKCTPTTGSEQTISAASASLANAAAGASVALAGTALSTAALYNANGPNLVANPGTVIAPIGTIDIDIGVGSTTGTWKHYIRYEPLKAGAKVV